MKVVISNRDKFIRKEIGRILTDQYPNCETKSFADCMLAAKEVYSDAVDVIIMGIDGIKLIPMLRKKEEYLRIIILADNRLHCDEAFSTGADAYITLPIVQGKLFSAVDGTLSADFTD